MPTEHRQTLLELNPRRRID